MAHGARLVVLAAVLALWAATAGATPFSGRVLGVADGDTLAVLREGRAVRVRLAGIDCPEKAQPFGAHAKRAASALAFGQTVTVAPRGTDRWGRVLGEVFLPDGRSLNRELVRGGLAWWYRKYSGDSSLGRLEDEARAAGRGLWAHPAPLAPWEFRRRGR